MSKVLHHPANSQLLWSLPPPQRYCFLSLCDHAWCPEKKGKWLASKPHYYKLVYSDSQGVQSGLALPPRPYYVVLFWLMALSIHLQPLHMIAQTQGKYPYKGTPAYERSLMNTWDIAKGIGGAKPLTPTVYGNLEITVLTLMDPQIQNWMDSKLWS